MEEAIAGGKSFDEIIKEREAIAINKSNPNYRDKGYIPNEESKNVHDEDEEEQQKQKQNKNE